MKTVRNPQVDTEMVMEAAEPRVGPNHFFSTGLYSGLRLTKSYSTRRQKINVETFIQKRGGGEHGSKGQPMEKPKPLKGRPKIFSAVVLDETGVEG